MPRQLVIITMQLQWLSSLLYVCIYGSSSIVHGFTTPPSTTIPQHQRKCLLLALSATTTDNATDSSAESVDLLNLNASLLGPQFIEKLKELHQYKLENGHCNVPRRYGPLGNFVNKQRQLYRKYQSGEKSSLTPARIKTLDDLGFEWSRNSRVATKERVDRIWLDRFEQLREYQAKHKTCRVPVEYDAQLHAWAAMQRKQYRKAMRGENASINAERMALLDEIGFETTSTHEDSWNVRIKDLKEYRELHGDTLVPIRYAPNPTLGQWVSVQRKKYAQLRSGKRPYGFSKERVKELDDLGFVWNYSEHEMERRWRESESCR